jgi:hypothetical protein
MDVKIIAAIIVGIRALMASTLPFMLTKYFENDSKQPISKGRKKAINGAGMVK